MLLFKAHQPQGLAGSFLFRCLFAVTNSLTNQVGIEINRNSEFFV